MKTRAILETELKDQSDRNDELRKELYAARDERNQAHREVKDVRDNFADLKRRLSEAESELARMRGYMQRVHEDDIVRDGMVEIEDERGKRMVPKRPHPMATPMMNDGFDVSYDSYGRPKKSTHWTSY